jgi:hypothetical protein
VKVLQTIRPWAVDAGIALGWGATLASMDQIDTLGEWGIALGVTLLAGILSGRYRILIVAIGGLLAAAVVASFGASCGSCEDDLSPVAAWALFATLLTIPAILMALGVFLRKEWSRYRDRRGPWDWADGSRP